MSKLLFFVSTNHNVLNLIRTAFIKITPFRKTGRIDFSDRIYFF